MSEYIKAVETVRALRDQGATSATVVLEPADLQALRDDLEYLSGEPVPPKVVIFGFVFTQYGTGGGIG